MRIRALSIWQPWADMIADGRKTVETRTWSTRHRGDVLICSSKRIDRSRVSRAARPRLGQALAIARLVTCRPLTIHDGPAAGWDPCEYSVDPDDPRFPDLGDRFAWVFADVRLITAFPVRGRQGLFYVEVPRGVL